MPVERERPVGEGAVDRDAGGRPERELVAVDETLADADRCAADRRADRVGDDDRRIDARRCVEIVVTPSVVMRRVGDRGLVDDPGLDLDVAWLPAAGSAAPTGHVEPRCRAPRSEMPW